MSGLYSHRAGAVLHLGKRDARPADSSIVRMGELLRAIPAGQLPAIPQHFGHGYAFGQDGWLMLGNGPDDTVFPGFGGAGDCFWAGEAHRAMESARNSRRPVPPFTGATVIRQYSAYSGYDPHTGANDQGTDLQEGIAWIQAKGIVDDTGAAHKITRPVTLEPGNLQELWAAAFLFENVGVGVQFQQAQMDQFDAGRPWEYVPGSPADGGHYVIVAGDNGLVSWGQRHGWLPSWYEKLNDESYAYLDQDRYSRVTGLTAEGFADADLEKFVALVAQQKTAG